MARCVVTRGEVDRFVAENKVVKAFLGKYDGGDGKGRMSSRLVSAYVLCRFFKWLRVKKGWEISPKGLLEDQLERLPSQDLEVRSLHVNLALEHAKKAFAELGDKRKYFIFNVIKQFYEFHEVSLTRAKGKFGRRRKRKHHPKQICMADAKKILGVVGQRERAILLIMLQSGMELGAVLYKFSYMWDAVKYQFNSERIKVEIDERKGNGAWYFTYISTDAIHELKKWLVLRGKMLEKLRDIPEEIEAGNPIFITNRGTPYGEDNFYSNYRYIMRRNGLKSNPYEKVSHMFRKLFKTEASVPDRGIDRDIVEFWMGHTDGVHVVGGEYDRTPEIYEKVIEKEYEKLEPWINIYSSRMATEALDPEATAFALELHKYFKANPNKRSKFWDMLRSL